MNKDLIWLYQHSPITIQNTIFSLAQMNRFREKHLSLFYKTYLQSLLRSQWYNQKELDHLQNKNLKVIINEAYNFVPYYHKIFRSLNLKPQDIRIKEDLKKLPIITKEDIRKNWSEFISKKFHWWQIVQSSTAGSTGAPLKLIWSKKSIIKEHCFEARLWTWARVNSRCRLAHFGSAEMLVPESQDNPPYWRISLPEKKVYFSPTHISEKNLSFYVKKLQHFRPQIILGHPSKIYIIARYIQENKISGINPRAIFTSSEMILPYQRATIEKVMGCKIFDYYGNNEHVSYMSQCEKGEYHIHPEYGIIEFLRKGEPAQYEETSEMVCTGLINSAMPLIRYKIEDLVVPSDEICDCNRQFPIVKSIQGRTRDIIITKDGRYLTTGVIVEGIDKLETINEWQIIQKSKEYYIINLTVDKTLDFKKDILQLREIVQKRVGEGEIEINIVDNIIRPKNKFRAVISEVNL